MLSGHTPFKSNYCQPLVPNPQHQIQGAESDTKMQILVSYLWQKMWFSITCYVQEGSGKVITRDAEPTEFFFKSMFLILVI